LAAHAPEIRFGLVGGLTDQNVWALFAGRDYSYNNYAVRANYWPRLYATSVPDQIFEPVTASSLPTATRQEGFFHTGTVPLRTDLRWTDGTPFTAQDVAFTVNTALAFELGFDWQGYYHPEQLDHAEAAEPNTVTFFFKRIPGVDAWQYGALQGPVVQEHYWSAKVAAAAESLPPDELRATIETLKGEITKLQQEANALFAATINAQGQQARELQAELKRKQGNLDEATNELADAEKTLRTAMDEARSALFQQDDTDEPLLGGWQPKETGNGAQTGATAVNIPNPGFPGITPNFDRALYITFDTAEAAAEALSGGKIDMILESTPSEVGSLPVSMTSPTRNMRFLLFNKDSPQLGAAPLRQALTCMIDQQEMASLLGSAAEPLVSFVAPDRAWYNSGATLPCTGLDAASRLAQASKILEAGGYKWTQAPSGSVAGQGLTGPDGTAVPPFELLVSESDEVRKAAAAYIEQQGLRLGIPLRMKPVPADVIDYAVLSSREFDMAVAGWRVSPYPGYLCNWFGASGTFPYEPRTVTALCGELAATSDLEQARALVQQIQTALAVDVPMVPLYTTVAHDRFRNVSYPFAGVLDGLGSVYGAPELAIPAVP
jgi:peptide/nickel transport system substrate-binding protein